MTEQVVSIHPAAELFPLLEGPDFDALVADIREHGLREPGKRDPEGRLLDGRNRMRACEIAGIPFDVVEVDLNGSDPVAYVVSMNVKRRNLTAGQRAIAAAHAWELLRTSPVRGKGRTAARLAADFGIGRESVERARALVAKAPDLAERVKGGGQLSEAYDDYLRREGRDKTTREGLATLRQSYPDLSEQVDADVLALREALAEAERRDAEQKQLRWAATVNVLDALAHFDRPADPQQAAAEAALLDTEVAARRGEQLTPERLRNASAWALVLAEALDKEEP